MKQTIVILFHETESKIIELTFLHYILKTLNLK